MDNGAKEQNNVANTIGFLIFLTEISINSSFGGFFCCFFCKNIPLTSFIFVQFNPVA
jgi:hypothetical protein